MMKTKIYTLIATLFFSLSMLGVAHAAQFTVEIKGMTFSPNNLSLSSGDTVKFINKDSAPHTGTAVDGSFDTGMLKKGQSAVVTIAKAGTFDYFCKVHTSMTGKINAK